MYSSVPQESVKIGTEKRKLVSMSTSTEPVGKTACATNTETRNFAETKTGSDEPMDKASAETSLALMPLAPDDDEESVDEEGSDDAEALRTALANLPAYNPMQVSDWDSLPESLQRTAETMFANRDVAFRKADRSVVPHLAAVQDDFDELRSRGFCGDGSDRWLRRWGKRYRMCGKIRMSA